MGALATCPGLARMRRVTAYTASLRSAADATKELSGSELSAGAEGWDLSPLSPLAPRKVELQAADLAASMQLLTEPQELLAFDFERQWPLPMQGQQEVRLGLLQEPILLGAWIANRQRPQQVGSSRGGGGGGGGGGASGTGQGRGADEVVQHPGAVEEEGVDGAGCGVLYWFEADCGEGSVVSTEPGTTHYGHWQQSFEFLGPRTAEGLLAAGSGAGGGRGGFDAVLAARWGPDRVMFEVTQVAALP
jgi:hypothetical protein